ncbi:hypothetical protein DFH07DRAFT_1034589 [Mycena maculata]|uniref:DUF6699 domain-containing protein n=1 Tax=Mycena maculata TaxID=230809 RepID=A0AAD7ITE6_9AGAR|nr:hypothetical protein DFH07DRAFT_1034589 [Mycena maculata]
MNIFSTTPKRSRRSSHVGCVSVLGVHSSHSSPQFIPPVNPWNLNSFPYTWPLSPYSSASTLPWAFSQSPPTPAPFTPSSWAQSGLPPTHGWGNSWYPQSPFSTCTPQAQWITPLPPVPSWHSPLTSFPGQSRYQPLNWDISTHPASHDNQAKFTDLKATVPDTVEKIRMYVEKPSMLYWTKQWGYATAYKRGGEAITLLDVLEAIYVYFQEPLAVDVLPPQYQSMLTATYTERIANSGAAYSGLARVDVLNGYRILSGLRPLIYGDAAGTMYIALHLVKA